MLFRISLRIVLKQDNDNRQQYAHKSDYYVTNNESKDEWISRKKMKINRKRFKVKGTLEANLWSEKYEHAEKNYEYWNE